MADPKMKQKVGNAEVVKTGHTATNAYGANPDAQRRGPGGSVRNVEVK